MPGWASLKRPALADYLWEVPFISACPQTISLLCLPVPEHVRYNSGEPMKSQKNAHSGKTGVRNRLRLPDADFFRNAAESEFRTFYRFIRVCKIKDLRSSTP
jgi:hypothetical protein